MDGTIAQIIMFAADFAPRNWALCQGQLLAISTNQALFSLLGTTYGGDGRTTFALPDFRGRSPLGYGTGPGLSNISLGEKAGAQNITLTTSQLPSHTHTGSFSVQATSAVPNADEPQGSIPAGGSSVYTNVSNANGKFGGITATTVNTGGSQPIDIRQPYLGINIIICLFGVFPSRN